MSEATRRLLKRPDPLDELVDAARLVLEEARAWVPHTYLDDGVTPAGPAASRLDRLERAIKQVEHEYGSKSARSEFF